MPACSPAPAGYPRATVRAIAFLWGVQFSFLSPALALLLVSLFGASTGEVAVVLAIYNAACLGSSWVIPRWADRHGDYVRPMAVCSVFTLALCVVLLAARSLPVGVVGLVLLGAPAAAARRCCSRTLVPRATIALLVAAFAVLQATNSASVAVTTLIVTRTLHLTPVWGGAALGVAAGLEVPGLLLLGRASRRWGDVQLLSLACLAGIAYYLGVSITPNGYVLVALQLLNARFVAVMAGVGLTLFQSIIAEPGAAAGLLSNAQRGGALLSGPLIGVGAVLGGGLRTVFVAAAVVASVSLGLFGLTARRLPRHSTPETVQAPSPPSPT